VVVDLGRQKVLLDHPRSKDQRLFGHYQIQKRGLSGEVQYSICHPALRHPMRRKLDTADEIINADAARQPSLAPYLEFAELWLL
jgi:hypothetical protein